MYFYFSMTSYVVSFSLNLLHYFMCGTSNGSGETVPACRLLARVFPGHIWASMRENLSLGFANNKGADQSVRMHRLISAFVIHFLECILFKLATGEISIF